MIHLASSLSNSILMQFKPEDVQPNAIDLRVDKVFTFNRSITQQFVLLANNNKTHFSKYEMTTLSNQHFKEGWELQGGNCYEIVMQGQISVGQDEAGFVITRSTLNRNGLFITSGLYDSNYTGVMAGMLHVNSPVDTTVYIERGAAVAQFLLFKAEALKQYAGSYGMGSDHDKMYNNS